MVPRMEQLDVHLGGQRPLGYSYWPLAEDDPGVEIPRESLRLVSPDGALVRGLLWLPPGGKPWKTAVILSHPRGDFSVHYACPLLAAAGYAVVGFGTRYQNNDTDCLHENCITDVKTVYDEMKRRGAEAVVLLGNSGGGSLMAMANAELGIGDGWIGMAAHPGEGVFMLQVIDPSVASEDDPLSTVPELDMYNPDNGWRPWPEPCHYDPVWLERYRAAQVDRVARLDAIAKAAIADNQDAAGRLRGVDKTTDVGAYRELRRRAVFGKYMTIYRTLADPAYLDLSIFPDERPMGSLFAFPDPFDANYGRGGLSRIDDHPRLAEHLVRAVEPRQARRHDAQGDGADDPRAPHGRHRDPRPPGEGDRRQRRRRGHHLRGDEGRPALPGGPSARGTRARRRVVGQALPVTRWDRARPPVQSLRSLTTH